MERLVQKTATVVKYGNSVHAASLTKYGVKCKVYSVNSKFCSEPKVSRPVISNNHVIVSVLYCPNQSVNQSTNCIIQLSKVRKGAELSS